MRLTDLTYAHAVMRAHGINPQKRYGQNFLTNAQVVDTIAEICADEECGIIEIGPGIGTLTEALCPLYKKVVAIEIDRNLIPVLHETLSRFNNLEIIEGDAMKIDFKEFCKDHFGDMRVCVCANLPYYITSPIIMKLLEEDSPIESITVMIQKEVADRLCANPGTSEYGAITAAVQYYSESEKCFNVAPGNFIPPPKVTSTVIKMNKLSEPSVKCSDTKLLFTLVRLAFEQRRKTLANALSSISPKEFTENVAEELGYPRDVRGEKLSIDDFAYMADKLKNNTNV
ncbi:MAG: 16S rRNA (adenine(1518)-N(6)/adenine(1519)-N(6))-dimethyltransferase RsmA [Clostridia bacterium]|nr:16S rRNA (adenine(1518)-N(6)/adenine(1519)-N(6))-dimethyltransferase RsmA [Clostridia bacterium]